MGNTGSRYGPERPRLSAERSLFLSRQRATLQNLRHEVSCTTTSPASAFQHRLLVNNLDVERLEEDLGSILMFDHTLHQELGCLVDGLVHRYTDESLHDRVRTSVSTPKLISTGKNTVFTSGLRGSENLFVIKTDVVSHLECLYEYVIGKLVINPLRAEIPNFMYTYGYHECGNYHTEEGKMIRWCNTDVPDKGYLYLEKIPGITWDKFKEQHGEDTLEFAEVMLQIINALYIADARCGFRHNDLHEENIIVRELAEPINIPFTVLGEAQFICSRWIPQIIDFGVSSAMYNGQRLESPSYYGKMNDTGKEFPYDIAGLIPPKFAFTGYNFGTVGSKKKGTKKSPTKGNTREDGATRTEKFVNRLIAQENEGPDKKTFYHIAAIFVDIYGREAIHDECPLYPSMPFTFINTTHRFYQRYFLTRLYHLSEYYDLINLINKYHLSNLHTWIRSTSVPTSTDVVTVTQALHTEVEKLLSANPTFIIRDGKYGVEIGLLTRIQIINRLADYVYVLRSYCRMVLPVARAHKLISRKDEKYVREVTETLSSMYQKLLNEAYRLYPVTERALLQEGFERDSYKDDMESINLSLVFLPRLEEM